MKITHPYERRSGVSVKALYVCNVAKEPRRPARQIFFFFFEGTLVGHVRRVVTPLVLALVGIQLVVFVRMILKYS